MSRSIRCLAVLAFGALLAYSFAAPAQDKKKDEKKKDEKKAPPKKTTFTDAKEAGIDYVIQGEYAGKTEGGAPLGCQVIALGNGFFQAVVLPGGLPGDGWDGKNKILMDGTVEGELASFLPTEGKRKYMAGSPKEFCATQKFPPAGHVDHKAAIKNETMNGRDADGNAFTLKKVMRKSPTLGAAPPQGAIVLFDGKNADEWKEGRITKDGLLSVESNTKRTFKDFKLHLEFVTPFQPTARSQSRGNSGVYLHGKHEIQVLDSFGLAGLDNECGGFYGRKNGSPRVNMCYPPLSWQTYDVVFQADPANPKKANVTVQHNGVVVHENFELPTGQGHLHLQNHGNPVFYRNIWLVELK